MMHKVQCALTGIPRIFPKCSDADNTSVSQSSPTENREKEPVARPNMTPHPKRNTSKGLDMGEVLPIPKRRYFCEYLSGRSMVMDFPLTGKMHGPHLESLPPGEVLRRFSREWLGRVTGQVPTPPKPGSSLTG